MCLLCAVLALFTAYVRVRTGDGDAGEDEGAQEWGETVAPEVLPEVVWPLLQSAPPPPRADASEDDEDEVPTYFLAWARRFARPP